MGGRPNVFEFTRRRNLAKPTAALGRNGVQGARFVAQRAFAVREDRAKNFWASSWLDLNHSNHCVFIAKPPLKEQLVLGRAA
jgi:hypothetical protein